MNDIGLKDANEKKFSDFDAELRKRELSSSENFDKSILTYASAFLGLSFIFLKDFLIGKQVASIYALYISWGSLVFAICLVVFSFVSSLKALQLARQNAKSYYLHSDDSAFSAPNRWDKITTYINYAAGSFFGIGVISLTFFVFNNFNSGVIMQNKPQTSSNSLQSNTDSKFGVSAPALHKKGLTTPAMAPKTTLPVTPAPSNNTSK